MAETPVHPENVEYSIPLSVFRRLVKDEFPEGANGKPKFNISSDALNILLCECEDHMTEMFHKASILASYDRRETIYVKDLQYVKGIDPQPPFTILDEAEEQALLQTPMGMDDGDHDMSDEDSDGGTEQSQWTFSI